MKEKESKAAWVPDRQWLQSRFMAVKQYEDILRYYNVGFYDRRSLWMAIGCRNAEFDDEHNVTTD